ncbi:hypothetical protein XENTR_v10002697 [Xenopus tropicalis]|nr:hypothetical protein XENTR_v10002697 [Xenopus tropicalis]
MTDTHRYMRSPNSIWFWKYLFLFPHILSGFTEQILTVIFSVVSITVILIICFILSQISQFSTVIYYNAFIVFSLY